MLKCKKTGKIGGGRKQEVAAVGKKQSSDHSPQSAKKENIPDIRYGTGRNKIIFGEN